ncbi:hypothetical protein [Sphingosinicella soli]|uniref:Uncharacterized protein n=1 Tax=Sphingosinicella soli TaxID=333708 RepID=A0A7W7B3F3_9SPHN|nr:hypothetical protein [Sphingosinicella soli]MBB4632310.1 hypothetical protein [Sphingosinicella soli]
MTLLLAAACATRAPDYNRSWAIFDAEPSEGNAVKLVYGVPNSDDIDLFAVCDREANVFELAFFTADSRMSVAEGTRTQLLVGPPEKITSLMASVQHHPSGEMMVVARVGLPPRFVRDWAGKRVTLAGQGTAMTLLARPEAAMIEDFLKRCGQ